MILGITLCLLVFISLPKLGRLLRVGFLKDEDSAWFLDAFIGTIFLIFLLLATAKFGLKPEIAAISLLPAWFFKSKLKFDFKLFAAVLLVLSLGGMSFWVQGILMSTNLDYPVLFYNVDTPFTLMLGQSFLTNGGYPPELLENEGMRLMYHYGYHIMLAFLSTISGFKVHVVHSIVFLPWMLFLKVGLIVSFIKRFAGVKLIWASALAVLVWLGYQQYLFNYFNPTTLNNLIVLPNRYTSLYLLGPSTFEGPFLLAILWLMWLKERKSFLLVALLLMFVPLFKIPVAPMLGLGFGFTILHIAWHEKDWKLLLYPLIAALGMFVSFTLFSASISVSPPIQLFSASHVQKDHWFSFVIPLMVLAVMHFASNKRIITAENLWLLAFILPMPILLLMINIEDVNTWQLISIVPFSAWFIVAFLLVQNRNKLLPVYRQGLIVLSCLILVIPIANAVFYITSIIQSPEKGHEYCDNDLLERTLQKIPVKGSVIATNDLRYPAENFSRDGNQFQFSAIYGHQMKVSNLSYLVTLDFLKKAMKFQTQLPNASPTQKDYEFLKSKGVTHFVLAISDSTLDGNPVVDYRIFKVR